MSEHDYGVCFTVKGIERLNINAVEEKDRIERYKKKKIEIDKEGKGN